MNEHDIVMLGLRVEIEKALRANGVHTIEELDRVWYRVPYFKNIGRMRVWDICDAVRDWKENK